MDQVIKILQEHCGEALKNQNPILNPSWRQQSFAGLYQGKSLTYSSGFALGQDVAGVWEIPTLFMHWLPGGTKWFGWQMVCSP